MLGLRRYVVSRLASPARLSRSGVEHGAPLDGDVVTEFHERRERVEVRLHVELTRKGRQRVP
jgi:hypothetical protein